MRNLFSSIKKKVKKLSSYQYYRCMDSQYEKAAQKSIQASLKVLPDHRLTGKMERIIDSYAKDKLGSIRFSPLLKAYAVYQGEFKEGWIPDNYFMRHVLPHTNVYHSGISDLRQLARKILKAPEMPDLGYFVRGCWVGVEDQLFTKAQAKEYFFSKSDQIIIKLNASMRGEGFFRLTRNEFDSFDEYKSEDFVVQLPIQQNEWFSRFSKDSVATLRITTVKPWGNPAKKLAAFMRFGRDGVDRVTANSRLVVGVTAQGWLDQYSFDSEWNLLDHHPDSKIRWLGNRLPDFEKMVVRCEQLHDLEGTMEIIGWDVVLDQHNQMQLMEWNTGYPGVVHSEMTTGPNFLQTDWSDLWRPTHRREKI
jgi:hypothetical protein